MKEMMQKFALVGTICLGAQTGGAALAVTLNKVQHRYQRWKEGQGSVRLVG